MKITTIRLIAYGPFTNTIIDLASAPSDFHLLVGPNEAGKSSTLRALRHLFFGIPARTGDNFRHGYPELRIGARLLRRDGETIEFVRRKGQAKTLRGADDETVLEDHALSPFLGGINQELFEQMFAIGHDDLIRGGEEIISGRGRVGEALFAAGAGLIRLQSVQQGFDQACGALFKPNGSTPAINQTTAAIKAVRKEQRQSLLQAKTWQTHDRSLRQAENQMDVVQRTLEQKKQRVARLERIHDALPLIARKREIDTEMAAFRGVPDLPDDFGEKRRDTEREITIAVRDRARSQERIEKLSQRLETLRVPEALLQHASAIEALQHELGSFRKAHNDRPGLEGRMRALNQQADEILTEIHTSMSCGSGRLPALPPSTVGEIQNLSNIVERLTAKLESATGRQRKLNARLALLTGERSRMPVPADVSRLETAVAAAQEAIALQGQRKDLGRSIQMLSEELNRRIRRQKLWSGPLERVDTLPFPSKETIDRFERQLGMTGRRIEKAQVAKEKVRDEISGIQADLQAIDLAHIVPTESGLDNARALRDKGWGIIRQTLEGRLPLASERDAFCRQVDNGPTLPDAFEASMKQADDIADRLRREADQVSRKGYLEARRKQLAATLTSVETELDAGVAEDRGLRAEWRGVWTPLDLDPFSPPEMRTWLVDMIVIREKLGELRAARVRHDTITGALAALQSSLRQALTNTGDEPADGACLAEMIHAAKTFINAQREMETRIASMDKEIAALTADATEVAADVADLNQGLAIWKTDWEKNVRRIGLQADASPTAALAVIESVRDARNKFNEAEILQKRIEGITRDAVAFGARVEQLVAAIAPDLANEPEDRAAELLYSRLTAARKDESEQRGLAEQFDAAQRTHNDAETRIHQSQALLDALCREAGCQTMKALVETQQRAQRRKELLRIQDSINDQLRRLSAGATVEEFITEAAAVDADGIVSRLETLADEIERLEQERSALDQTIGSERAERKRMDGSGAAASHAEKAERLLASLESRVEQYARLKIASVILARTVEQYRNKHQGPLISRASDLFARMTLGAFSSLRAEYDEKGNPILVGIRCQTGAQVGVDGMSDGTADQLYLALRLASLEQYLEHNEPLPFIVDDILLRFDDYRALATLRVLADLSQKMQILFFTHHHHLVELAERSEELLPKMNVHPLGG
jgi:uncharacterized protein YhaN